MHRLLRFFPILLLTLCGAPLASQTLTFQELVHDFGRLKQQQSAKHEFVFTNSGKDTAALLPPKASCGCTAALLSETFVAPGKTGRISVEFRSYAGSLGPIEKNVQVFQLVDGQPALSATLTIKASIAGEVIPNPMLVNFEADEGGRATVTIELKSESPQTLKLDNISLAMTQYIDTSSGTAYHADRVLAKPLTDFTLAVDDEELAPGATTTLRLSLAAKNKGQMNGHVRIVLPASEVRVPVSGVVYRRQMNRAP